MSIEIIAIAYYNNKKLFSIFKNYQFIQSHFNIIDEIFK